MEYKMNRFKVVAMPPVHLGAAPAPFQKPYEGSPPAREENALSWAVPITHVAPELLSSVLRAFFPDDIKNDIPGIVADYIGPSASATNLGSGPEGKPAALRNENLPPPSKRVSVSDPEQPKKGR